MRNLKLLKLKAQLLTAKLSLRRSMRPIDVAGGIHYGLSVAPCPVLQAKQHRIESIAQQLSHLDLAS